jgi:uncharacterized protein YbjT (DUF2867 family)
MKILVLGGYGLIGSGVVDALLEAGHDVTGLGRSVEAARRRRPQATWVAADLSILTTPERWAPYLRGFGAVVNCAGVLQDSPRDDIRKIQRDAIVALIAACERAGVSHYIQISAVGADPHAETLFMATKGEADAALRASSLDWTILRPALVLSETAYGATAMLRALAAMPLVVPVAGAGATIRTVDVRDVGTAVVACIEGRVPTRRSYDLAETEPHDLSEIVKAMRAWLGFRPAPVVRLPDWLSALSFRFGDVLGYLGWRTPMRTTAFREALAGIRGDPSGWIEAGGLKPAPLDATLARLPSTIQERWYARAWLARPVAIATLSAFWIVSGLMGLLTLHDAAAMLAIHGVGSKFVDGVVLAGSAVDVALGLAVLVRSAHKAALAGMIAVTVIYLAVGTVVAPGLWLDPLGAFLKAIPAAVLALVLLALCEER